MSKTKNVSTYLNSKQVQYLEFIKERIERSGGTTPLQHLTGHLSQLPYDVRESIGTSQSDLSKFLRENNIFRIDEKGYVSLTKTSLCVNLPDKKDKEKRDSSCSSVGSDGSLPSLIENGKGAVTKIFPAFGFIQATQPIKTSVYFTGAQFMDENKSILSEFDLQSGQILHFNARKGHPGYEAKYRATFVWIAKKDEKKNNSSTPRTRKKRETGLYDSLMTDGDGVVQNVFPTHGFIENSHDPKNTVFFHKNHVCRFENVLDLTKVLKKGDKVEYCAVRSTKIGAKVRWEATKVWLKGKSNKKPVQNSDEEIFMSGAEDLPVSAVSDNENISSQKFSKNIQSHTGLHLVNGTKLSSNCKVVNESGKICPRAEGVVIKFGPKCSDLADADSSLFYMYGSKVIDISWEFSEGDLVQFDAIKIKSAPGWKAVLVWVGEKPNVILPDFAGDFGEFIDEIPENHSYTSKTSGDSVNSAASSYSSKKSSLIPKSFESSQTSLSGYKETSDTFRNSLPAFNESFEPRMLSPTFKDDLNSFNLSDQETKSSGSPKPLLDKEELNHVLGFTFDGYNHGTSINWGDSPFPDEKFVLDPEFNERSFQKSQNLNVRSEQLNTLEENKEYSHEIKLLEHDIADEKIVQYSVKKFDFLQENEADLTKSSSNFNFSLPNFDDELEQEDTFAGEIIITKGNTGKLKLLEPSSQIMIKSSSDLDTINEHLSAEKCKEESSIRRFTGITGKISKVHSRYAEIECVQLRKPVAFIWTDLYRNGVSVQEHFDDLREVVKKGDIINFDCFEIVDDEEQCWQKITVAWKGKKPKTKQMTPEEFIKEHNLKVSLTPESENATNCEKETVRTIQSSQGIRFLNSENVDTSVISKKQSIEKHKFLSEANIVPENNESSESISPLDSQSILRQSADVVFDTKDIRDALEIVEIDEWPQFKVSSNLKSLIKHVSKILHHRGFQPSGLVDGASTEIVNFLQSTFATLNSCHPATNIRTLCEASCQTEVIDVNPRIFFDTRDNERKRYSQSSGTRSTSVQTFVTGDVVSQIIFPQ